MRVFLSAGEPSGDLHGSNFARAIQAVYPGIELSGFGGDKMSAAGVDLHFPLAQFSIMWFSRSIIRLPRYFKLLDEAERYFRREKPDAIVMIDCPGFHWHLAKRAKAIGIPVYYFVPPQLWAWGGWRTRKMRKNFDTILTALPFEDKWFKRKGLNTYYIGHPYFDELDKQRPDMNFVREQRQPKQPVVAILPGSRGQEVTGNIPIMLATAKKIHAARPDTRFLVAAFNERQANAAKHLLQGCDLPLDVHIGKTPEIIESADVCLAVSGSVGLELMYRQKPSVIVYKYSRLARMVSKQFITCPYISLVNLLAEEEIFPEFLTYRDDSAPIADRLLQWLNDPVDYARSVAKLAALRERVAIPGACQRAAEFVVDRIQSSSVAEVTAA
ncbi:lipid-A-disaccharide synthase [Limnoglobus roseus]|uniref:Lipid-A-disaccharide synthase n=1 Tax=Limnoglobus roseus TaxID=2598579 RepID=A0A5C1AIH8_9BACT|nr:lipid-A-disaccharide synthase [Limnoglobus roseus]QEL18063.1 lipid-A-disaccharide synthase [Limnoglobus roseus]